MTRLIHVCRLPFLIGVLLLIVSACGTQTSRGPVPAPPEQLVLAGPPVPPTVLLTHMTNAESLAEVSERVIFETTGDLRTLQQGIEAGRIHAGLASTTELAVLRNQGVPIQLLDVFGWNLLYLLSGEKEIDGWESLRGSKVAMPYRGSVNDVLFTFLATEAGLSVGDDLVMRYASNPLEASEVLAGKQVQAAVLGEPWVTSAIIAGEEEDEPIRRAIDLQAEWGDLLETEPRIPQVAFFVSDELAADHPEITAALRQALVDATTWAVSDPDAATEAARLTRLGPEVVAESLRNTGLTAIPASQVRSELELLFQVLVDANPELIGGMLPDDGFYGQNEE